MLPACWFFLSALCVSSLVPFTVINNACEYNGVAVYCDFFQQTTESVHGLANSGNWHMQTKNPTEKESDNISLVPHCLIFIFTLLLLLSHLSFCLFRLNWVNICTRTHTLKYIPIICSISHMVDNYFCCSHSS
jgi:hypothetical protein